MRIIRQVILLTGMILSALFSNAQQENFNLQRINPAYAGSWKTIGLTGSYQMMTPSFDNSPMEYAFSFQAPLDSLNSGIGFSILNQKVGLEDLLSLNFDYSYHVPVFNQSVLRFGIKGAFSRCRIHLSDYELYPDQKYDEEFSEDIFSNTSYNMGVGLYLSSPAYFLSLSVPEIVTMEIKLRPDHDSYIKNANLFFTGGMIINLSNFVKLKPGFNILTSLNEQFTLGNLSTHFLLGNKVWLGGMIRSDKVAGTLAQVIILKRLRAGYAYNFKIDNEIKNFHIGWHEMMLSYEIPTIKSHPVPVRYF